MMSMLLLLFCTPHFWFVIGGLGNIWYIVGGWLDNKSLMDGRLLHCGSIDCWLAGWVNGWLYTMVPKFGAFVIQIKLRHFSLGILFALSSSVDLNSDVKVIQTIRLF